MSSNSIEHLGRVDEVTRNGVRVIITSKSACASCHARGSCTASESAEKVIVISNPTENFIVGENVKVLMKQSLGFRALALGYIAPLVVVVASLIILIASGVSEGISGVLAIAMLIPYFAILRCFNNKISKQFSFTIERM